MNLAESGASLLAETARRLPHAEAEIFLTESESRSVEWSEGSPENIVVARGHGAGLRLIDGSRLGFAHTNQLEGDSVDALIQNASDAARFTAPDTFLGLPPPVKPPTIPKLDLVDHALRDGSVEERSAFLSSLEETVRKRDPRLTKVLRASYREGRGLSYLANSKGVLVGDEGTHVSFSLACVAVENGETQIGYGFQAARHYADLDRAKVIDNAVEGTLALLGGKQVPSGRYDLVLDPLIAAEMLELFAGALRADQVQKGKSFLASRVGEKIGAACVTLVDDGLRPRGLGSSLYDGEGLPTQRNVLIQGGVLQGFLYDSYTARKAKRASTGSADRGSYKGIPEPGTTNFYLEAGATPPEELMAGIRSGLYVRQVLGLHTVDTISGDYSLGIMGQRIENGKRTHAVRGVTIAGNLLDLLKNVEAIGSDLTFMASIGSPTLRIRDVSVGGS